MMRNLFFWALTFVTLLPGLSPAEDWPQYLGPNQDGISRETGLMKDWPETGLKVVWTAEVGEGFGTPCAKDGKVYLLDRVVDEKDILRCWELATGEELWSTSYSAPGEPKRFKGSRTTPAVDEERVYSTGPNGQVKAIDLETHQPVWSKHLVKDFGGKWPSWGLSQSPALYRDWIIVAPIGPDGGIYALDRATGETAWKSAPLEGDMSYVSPRIATIGGTEQVIIITTAVVAGVDASNGKVLWTTADWTCRNPIPNPVPCSDGRVFLMGGYNAGAAMLEASRPGDSFSVETLYKTRECNGQLHTPIFHKNHLFMNANDGGYKDGLVCLALDGTVKWRTGEEKNYEWGGLILADDVLYAIDGSTGDLCILAADTESFQEIDRAPLLSGEMIWSPMIISEGHLLARDQSKLVCVDIRE